jgi:hypothetical protein
LISLMYSLCFSRCLLSTVLMMFTIVITPVAHSATVQGLYSASVAVVGQDALERQRGFRLALESVLAKLTGDGVVATLPELDPLMRNASAHVAQYRYRALETTASSQSESAGTNLNTTDSGAEPALPATSIEATHVLKVSFAPASLNRALNKLGLPLWGAERPETLLWLAVEETADRYILGSASRNQVRESLDQVAEKRALPILLPLMDLQDRSVIHFSDVRGGFTRRVQEASTRYGVDTILTGSLRRHQSGWSARWVLFRNQRIYRWQANGEEIVDVIIVGMEGLANQLAKEFSISVSYSKASVILLRVDLIESLDDYARVLAYLGGLAVVEKVSVETITPLVSYFRLDTLGGGDNLRNAIALNSVLRPSEKTHADTDQDESLMYYELIP